MSDNLTKKQRSYCMSRVKSKWTSQELKVHNYLKSYKIKHRMHPKLIGSPDLLLVDTNTAIFLQGCFWHECPKCFILPSTNRRYWQIKIEKNVKRDKKNVGVLKKEGFKIIKIWEHELNEKFQLVLNKIIKASKIN